MPEAAVFPIGYVSITTGLSAHVLRAWERRYTAVTPCRSASGRRLYSQEDIDRLVLLQRAVAKGHSISQIAGLDDTKLAGLTGSPVRPSPASKTVDGVVTIPQTIEDCLQATTRLDDVTLTALLQRAELHHNRKTIIDAIIVPFMADVGRLWRQGDLRIAHEHLASCAVEACLYRLLDRHHRRSPRAPRLMIAAPAGQHCRLGTLAVAVLAQDQGWHPVLIGADLPMEEIASARLTTDPQMIALSLTCRTDDRFIDDELLRLGELLDNQCPFIVGGLASAAYRDSIEKAGGVVCASSDELIDRLS